MNLSIFIFAFLLIIVIDAQNVAESDLLVANYDNLEHKLKAFEIRKPLVLHCNITQDGEFELAWEKDGVEVRKVEELKNRYAIIEAENKFIISRTAESDAGHYSCRLGDTKKEFHVLAELVVRSPANVGVPESEDLVIECEVVGSTPRIHWEIGNLTVSNSSGRYTLQQNGNGIKNAVLTVKNVTLDDRGVYSCVATNILSELKISAEARDTTFVRVKSHLASVWPALGIAAEVLILGVITIFARKADLKMILE